MRKTSISNLVDAALFLGLTAILSGCGGGGSSSSTPTYPPVDPPSTGSFTVGGSIAGNDASVNLSLNGVEESFTGQNFTFTAMLDSDDFYAVSFTSTTSNQVCVVTNGGGIITANVTNVDVICSGAVIKLGYDDASISGAFAAGDFNGDGMSDLAMAINTMPSHISGSNNDMVRFTFGTGNGGFNGMIDVASINSRSAFGLNNTIATDLNNDGIDDFGYSNDVLQAYTGNNTNTPQLSFSSLDNTGIVLHSLDIDGNGYNDFISKAGGASYAGGPSQKQFAIHYNNGDGSFADVEYFANWAFDPELTSFFARGIHNFTIDDFNNDGRKDILAIVKAIDQTNFDTILKLALYPGKIGGGFDLPTSTLTLNAALYLGESVLDSVSKEIASGDFDGDGDSDIAITSTTNYLQVMLNNGSGVFTEGQHVLVGTKPINVRAADFNNDGLLDLVSSNITSRTVVISFGNGNGTFGDSTSNALSWVNIQLENSVDLVDMDVADFDGDSYLDIIIGENGSNHDNDGRGSVLILRSPGQ